MKHAETLKVRHMEQVFTINYNASQQVKFNKDIFCNTCLNVLRSCDLKNLKTFDRSFIKAENKKGLIYIYINIDPRSMELDIEYMILRSSY